MVNAMSSQALIDKIMKTAENEAEQSLIQGIQEALNDKSPVE